MLVRLSLAAIHPTVSVGIVEKAGKIQSFHVISSCLYNHDLLLDLLLSISFQVSTSGDKQPPPVGSMRLMYYQKPCTAHFWSSRVLPSALQHASSGSSSSSRVLTAGSTTQAYGRWKCTCRQDAYRRRVHAMPAAASTQALAVPLPPQDYDYKAEILAETYEVVCQRYPQLSDLVDQGECANLAPAQMEARTPWVVIVNMPCYSV